MQSFSPRTRPQGQAGFALILAILSLLLLTFLGLTLAATTTTELQIAANQRWSQQARYNAEAGLEVAQVILRDIAAVRTDWRDSLHQRQTAAWTTLSYPAGPPGLPLVAGPPADQWGLPARHFENWECAIGNGRVGLGNVLSDGNTLFQNVSTLYGRTLNGSVTIWIRRPVKANDAGQFEHETANNRAVVTAEGVAPYAGNPTVGLNLKRRQQAVRLMEISLSVGERTPCSSDMNDMLQQGLGANGTNFLGCLPVDQFRGQADEGGQ